MTEPRHIAVIDIGKSNIKLALVDLETLSEIEVVTRPNLVRPGPPWPHFDTEGHWAFILDGLRQFQHSHGIDAISTTTHGASIVLLKADGNLAAPILDYEHDGPMETAVQYDIVRPSFAQTGSPRLANGLNVGAQLHWQFLTEPDLQARTAHVLTYPQYWGHRLTGLIASDVTSIGCHTDLWSPHDGKFSDLVAKLGIANKMAPVRRSGDILGPIRPDLAGATGVPLNTPVLCGIHDSNASLYPHLMMQEAPFSVVSTGTWVIAMAVGGTPIDLDPTRDTLVNVNAFGDAVPSARFMGGREFEMIQQGCPTQVDMADVETVLAQNVMLLPAVDPSTGPYQGRKMSWHGSEPIVGSGIRAVALSFYLALMTETSLQLTGADGPIIVEGPFAANSQYLAMLAAASGRPVLQSTSATGTSIGAALLFSAARGPSAPDPIPAPQNMQDLKVYAAKWQKQTAGTDI